MSSETSTALWLSTAVALAAAGLGPGCTYHEELPNADLTGTVRIPKDLIEIELADTTGKRWTVNDPRAIGPIYIGVYAGIDDSLYPYPHPEWGPVLGDGNGDAYPYGGTTVGRMTWGCYAATVCRTVTGRYDTYDDVLQFFRDELRRPIVDDDGREITSATEFQEKCFEAEYVTSDAELDLIGPKDFTLNGDYYEAPFEILHTQWTEGVSVWGFVDMPDPSFTFATCDGTDGDYYYNYDEQYYKGTNADEILNDPGYFIGAGDLVSWDAPVITDPDQPFTLELGYKYE
ncbi:MAG: hypothetical protein D6798_07300 [Deltaproteobacteria bacterium]|nr:MAG: hypothetical protein D6798_07300 [Deltaproteobacteria bacterium]